MDSTSFWTDDPQTSPRYCCKVSVRRILVHFEADIHDETVHLSHSFLVMITAPF